MCTGAQMPVVVMSCYLTEVLTRFVLLCDSQGAGSAEHHKVKQRVSTQSVSTMDTGTCRLAAGIQSTNHLVLSIGMSDHLMGKKIKGVSLCLFST